MFAHSCHLCECFHFVIMIRSGGTHTSGNCAQTLCPHSKSYRIATGKKREYTFVLSKSFEFGRHTDISPHHCAKHCIEPYWRSYVPRFGCIVEICKIRCTSRSDLSFYFISLYITLYLLG